MEIKYTDWKKIDLSEFKEGQNWGHLNPATNKKYLRGSQAYNRTHALDELGFLKLWIDYTDTACPFRDELTEEDWPLKASLGDEDIYCWVYRTQKDYAPSNCKTPKSIFQMYCRDTKGLCPGGGTGDVMFQLEVTGETQVKPDFPIGSIQVIHNAATTKYRKATNVIPQADDMVFIKVRVKRGLGADGYIKCELNGQVVYEVRDNTCFPWDPTCVATPKWGIYDHMINNEGSKNPTGNNNRLKHLNAGIKNFTLGISPITILRRSSTDPAFGDWHEAVADPYREVCDNDSDLQKQIEQLEQQNAQLQSENTALKSENTALEGELSAVSTKVGELNDSFQQTNQKLNELVELVS